MAEIRTFVKFVKPYCRKDKVLLSKYDEKTETFHCPMCDVGVTSEDIERHCYAPDYYTQRNPFVIFE